MKRERDLEYDSIEGGDGGLVVKVFSKLDQAKTPEHRQAIIDGCWPKLLGVLVNWGGMDLFTAVRMTNALRKFPVKEVLERVGRNGGGIGDDVYLFRGGGQWELGTLVNPLRVDKNPDGTTPKLTGVKD